MHKYRLILALLLCTFGLAAQSLYKVVKPDGTVVYTDKPGPGAEPVTLGKLNSVKLAPVPKLPVIKSSREPQESTAAKPQLSIVSPKDQEAVRSNNGDLKVRGELSSKAKGGTFELYIDDVLNGSSGSPNFLVQYVDRGEHKLQLKYLQQGKVIASSEPVTIYLQRISILNRPGQN